MQDDWFGHRDPFTGEPFGDKDEYTQWDYALMNAYQTLEDFTDPESGLPVWELEDEAVEVDAVAKQNKYLAAKEEKTGGKKYKPMAGEVFTPKIWSRRKDEEGNEKFQTFREWVESQVDKG